MLTTLVAGTERAMNAAAALLLPCGTYATGSLLKKISGLLVVK
jgi:hypothetical protein